MTLILCRALSPSLSALSRQSPVNRPWTPASPLKTSAWHRSDLAVHLLAMACVMVHVMVQEVILLSLFSPPQEVTLLSVLSGVGGDTALCSLRCRR